MLGMPRFLLLLALLEALLVAPARGQSSATPTVVEISSFSYGVSEVASLNDGTTIDLIPSVEGSVSEYLITPSLSGLSKLNASSGYIEIAGDLTPGLYTVTARNSLNSLSTSFNVVRSANSYESPARFLTVGEYDSYQFVVGYPVNLAVRVQGSPTMCTMTGGGIPGLEFSLSGLVGTPTTENLTPVTLSLMCSGPVSKTNVISFTTMVHSAAKTGLIGNYWKWTRYTLAYPCNVLTSAFSTAGAKLLVRRVTNTVSIKNDDFFKFNGDFDSFYGATWTGYLNVSTTRSYNFRTESRDGSFIQVDGRTVVDHMKTCHGQSAKNSDTAISLTKGFHTLILGYNRRNDTAYVTYSWDKSVQGTFVEFAEADLSYIPPRSVELTTPVMTYDMGSTTPISDAMQLYDITVLSYSISPPLPSGLNLDPTTGLLSGKPTVTTNYAAFVYTIVATTHKGPIETKLILGVRDYTTPSIPYVVMKRSPSRRCSVPPDQYYQPGWTIDQSVYPSNFRLYWSLDKVADGSPGSVACEGVGTRLVLCSITPAGSTVYTGMYDPGPEYDISFQYHGTCRAPYATSSYVVTGFYDGNRDKAAALRLTFTCADTTPIPGWTFFGIETVHRNWNPEYPRANSFCCIFSMTNQYGEYVLELERGYPDWLIRQGTLLAPGVVDLVLKISTDANQCSNFDAVFNLTINSKSQVITMKLHDPARTERFTLTRTTCKADSMRMLPDSPIGTELPLPCDSNQVGDRLVRCEMRSDGTPYWGSETNRCRTLLALSMFYYPLTRVMVPLNREFTMRPMVGGDYDTFEFVPSSLGKSVFNSATGVITLISSTAIAETAVQVTVSHTKDSSKKLTVLLELGFKDFGGALFEPVMNIKLYPSSVFNWAKGYPVYTSILTEGSPTKCGYNPPLPAGLTMTTQSISGTPSEVTESATTYSMNCSNDYSASNILTFTSRVLNNGVSGFLHSTYWRYTGFGSLNCDTKYEAGETPNTDIVLERYDSVLQRTYDANKFNWDINMGPYLREKWGVTMDSYVSISAPGSYVFSLKAKDSAWLLIDNVIVSELYGCHSDMTANSTDTPINLGAGFHSFRLYYFQASKGSGMNVYVKSPTSETGLLNIAQLSVVPKYYLGYLSQIANYAMSSKIEPNVPWSNEAYSSYTLQGSLPTGLNFESSTGIITGQPNEESGGVRKSYVVTGHTQTGKTETTTLYMEVVDYKVPYNLRLTSDAVDVAVTKVSLIPGESLSLIARLEGTAIGFSLSSRYMLSNGFSFNDKTGAINGVCSGAFSETIVISAYNDAGATTLSLPFECLADCPAGQEQIIMTVSNYLSITQTVKVILTLKDSVDPLLSRVLGKISTQPFLGLCIDVNKHYVVSGTSNNPQPLIIEAYMSTILKANVTVEGNTGGTTSFIAYQMAVDFTLAAPSIHYPENSYPMMIGDEISISALFDLSTTIISNCVVTPTLPNGLTLDRKSCRISGSVNLVSEEKTYQISPSNGAGTGTTVSLLMSVRDCGTSGLIGYKLVYRTGPNPATYTWTFSTLGGTDVAMGDASRYGSPDSSFPIVGCVEETQYLLTLAESGSQPWSPEASVSVTLYGKEILVASKQNNAPFQEFSVLVDTVISSASRWRFSVQSQDASWSSKSYDNLTTFQEGYVDDAPRFVGATMYMATKFSTPDLAAMSSFRLNVTHKAGIIIYLNGVEHYRRFLPVGTVNFATYATGGFGSLTMVSLILPTLNLLEGTGANTLSMEIHRQMSDSATKLEMTCVGVKTPVPIERCYMFTADPSVKVIASSGHSADDRPPENALDLDPATEWMVSVGGDPSIRAWMTISMGDNVFAWFNQYGWRSIADRDSAAQSYTPQELRYEGYDGSKWETIGIEKPMVTGSSQILMNHAFANTKVYSQFNITVTRTRTVPSDMRLADLFFGACGVNYCTPDGGFTYSTAGARASAACEPGYNGIMFRYCIEGSPPVWDTVVDRTRCSPSPPSNLRYNRTSYQLMTYTALTEPIVPMVDFIGALIYSISPALPTGLAFDNNTGIISGAPHPLLRLPSTQFIIVGLNPASEDGSEGVQTSLQLTVTSNFCETDGEWKATEGGTTAALGCPPGYIGFIKRPCIDGVKPSWSTVDDSECVLGVKKSTVNVALVASLSVFAFVAVVAIVLCCFARFRAGRRRAKRARDSAALRSSRNNVQMSKGSALGMHSGSASSRTRGRSIRL